MSLVTGLIISVSVKVELGLGTGLLLGPSGTRVEVGTLKFFGMLRNKPRASYMLTLGALTEDTLS